jgi:putative FmdB family regulatory protein
MPVYEYECENCSHRFELKRSFSDSSTTDCPKCGGNTRLIFSAVPVIFKGSGFYVTDNRAKNPAGSTRGRDGDTPTDTKASKEPVIEGNKEETAASSGDISEKPASSEEKKQ